MVTAAKPMHTVPVAARWKGKNDAAIREKDISYPAQAAGKRDPDQAQNGTFMSAKFPAEMLAWV